MRVAVVTGAGTGVGAAVAARLAGDGFVVVLVGRRRDRLDQVAERIRDSGGGAEAVATDVTDPDAVASLFDRVEQRFGRLDLLVNNAGVGGNARPVEELELATWRVVLDTNVTGAFLCTQHAVRLMKRQDPSGGRIINNGSLSAHVPRPHSAAYTAAKHAIAGLTKATALDCRSSNIACGQIDIGNAATAITERMADVGALQPDGRRISEPRIDVADVARAVSLMAALPLDTNVSSLVIMANEMPFVGRG